MGLNLGVKLANPNSPNEGWTTVMHRNPKAVKVQHANKGKIVTWVDITRPKVGIALDDKLNRNRPKYKAEVVSWKSKNNRGWNHGNGKI